MKYLFVKTRPDGEPLETARVFSLQALRIVLADFPGSVAKLEHLISLANAAPGHPVDVMEFRHDRETGEPLSLLYSAQITAVRSADS